MVSNNSFQKPGRIILKVKGNVIDWVIIGQKMNAVNRR